MRTRLQFVLSELVVSVLLVTGCGAPAANIDDYSDYYLGQSDEEPKNGNIKVTWFGTTMLLFDDGETQLLIDGFLSRPTLKQVITGRIQTDKALVDAVLSQFKVNRLKAVFVAHSHYDHALDIAYIIQKTRAHLHGSESTLNIGRGGNLTKDQMSLYEPGRELTFGQFTVTVLSSKHSPQTWLIPALAIAKVIGHPLQQYVEGGSFDFLIKHGDHTILVKPSANWVEGALDNVRAEVLFLSTATLGDQDQAFRDTYYEQTVGKVQPQLVIPIHWDNFFLPLSDHLVARKASDLTTSFDFLTERLGDDGIQFGIMQGCQSVKLFGNGRGERTGRSTRR